MRKLGMGPEARSRKVALGRRRSELHAAHRRPLAALVVLPTLAVCSLFLAAVPAAAARDARSAHAFANAGRTPSWASTGFIAYSCGGAVCLSRPDGTEKRSILPASVRLPVPQWDPALSPDGRSVAFRGYWGAAEGDYSLYTVRSTGCSLHRLTGTIAGSPAWSPDSRWIAFDTSGEGQLFKIRAAGGGLARLVRSGASSPAWSPDGRRVAFVRTRGDRGELWLVDADGSHARLFHRDRRGSDEAPQWSHDGRKIVFVDTASGQSVIKVMSAAGGPVHALTPAGGTAWNPVWLPGDAGIAFLSGQSGRGSLFVMREDGSGAERIATLGTQQFAWVAGPLPRKTC